MSHEIDLSNGRENMAYTGAVPWHGLGKRLSEGADLDQWRAAAGLDWEARVASLSFKPDESSDEGQLKIQSRKLLYRSDTKAELAVVGRNYKPVQPKTVIEFFRNLISEHGMIMETAGSLMDGRRIWALARTGNEMRIQGTDSLHQYLLLATSYDGTLSTSARPTSVRVVCQNTLSAAYGQEQHVVRIPHSTDFQIEKVQMDLGYSAKGWNQFCGVVEHMADYKPSLGEVEQFFWGLVDDKDTAFDHATEAQARQLKRLLSAYYESPGAHYRSALGTTWGLVNAVTYLEDHDRQERRSGGRLNSAWFGPGEQRKAKAWRMAREMIGGQILEAA